MSLWVGSRADDTPLKWQIRKAGLRVQSAAPYSRFPGVQVNESRSIDAQSTMHALFILGAFGNDTESLSILRQFFDEGQTSLTDFRRAIQGHFKSMLPDYLKKSSLISLMLMFRSGGNRRNVAEVLIGAVEQRLP